MCHSKGISFWLTPIVAQEDRKGVPVVWSAGLFGLMVPELALGCSEKIRLFGGSQWHPNSARKDMFVSR